MVDIKRAIKYEPEGSRNVGRLNFYREVARQISGL
jgi:hypothetical protein